MAYRRSYGRRPARRTPRRRYTYSARPSGRPRARRSYRRMAPRRSTRPQTEICRCKGDLTPGQKFILAQADPFDPKCLGAKIPDTSTVPSTPVADVENVSLPLVVATNQRCWALLPSYNTSIVSSTEGAAGWTWGAAFAGGATRTKRVAYVGAYELDRPVAHSVRISSAVAPTAATGFVHVAISFESNYQESTWTWPTTTAGMTGCQFYKRVTLASLTQSPLTIINKFTDETAFRYSSANSPSGSGTNAGDTNTFQVIGGRSWGALLIAVEGVGSLAPLNVEHLLLSEAIPRFDSIVMGTNAAPSQPAILAGAGNMGANTDFVHTEMEQQSYIAQALESAAEGAARAGDEAAIRFLIPAANQVGYTAMGAVAAMGAAALGIGGVNNIPYRLGA